MTDLFQSSGKEIIFLVNWKFFQGSKIFRVEYVLGLIISILSDFLIATNARDNNE